MSHWSGSRPPASVTLSILDPHRDSSRISCCCPVSRRSYSFRSAGLTLSQAPAGHRWGRCWGGPAQSPGSGPGWPELVTLPAILHPALPLLVHPVCSHSHAAVGKAGEEVEGVVPTTGWLFSGQASGVFCLPSTMAGGPVSAMLLALLCHYSHNSFYISKEDINSYSHRWI